MKKIFILSLIVIFLAPVYYSFAQSNDPTSVTPNVQNVLSTQPCNTENQLDCYQLLEPIPLESGIIDSINTSAQGEGGVGGFVNFMFEIGIGVAGVLGVVMLVIYGFQYAANDKNVSTFSALKEKITNVILGLLLLLSIFVILNTINPDLLVVEPEIEKQILSIEAEREDLPNNVVTNMTTGQSTACKGGLASTSTVNQTGLLICADIAQKFKEMIAAANSQGVNITVTGTGGRSMEQQIALRRKNCGTSQYAIYQAPSTACKPWTAKPGSSMHQLGLALDLRYNGTSICFTKTPNSNNSNKCRQSGNKGFLWLDKNAKNYGFFNLNAGTEPWHWSINGK